MYVVAWEGEADLACQACCIFDSSAWRVADASCAADMLGRYVTSSLAECGEPEAAGAVAASAGSCGDKKEAAATLASVAAAAAGAACGSRIRDGLLWRPNGLLSEQGALTGQAEGQACGAPDTDGEPNQGRFGLFGKLITTGQTARRAATLRPEASHRSPLPQLSAESRKHQLRPPKTAGSERKLAAAICPAIADKNSP